MYFGMNIETRDLFKIRTFFAKISIFWVSNCIEEHCFAPQYAHRHLNKKNKIKVFLIKNLVVNIKTISDKSCLFYSDAFGTQNQLQNTWSDLISCPWSKVTSKRKRSKEKFKKRGQRPKTWFFKITISLNSFVTAKCVIWKCDMNPKPVLTPTLKMSRVSLKMSESPSKDSWNP